MPSIRFPPVKSADKDGVLAIGGNLEVSTLKQAYSQGIFPWPQEGLPLLWFSPPKRAILKFNDFTLSDRDKRYFKKNRYDFRVNTQFSSVIRACSRIPRNGQKGTWITSEMISAYIKFHQAGHAHSFEVFSSENKLVGGMYGVLIGKIFAGESMFHYENNASKFVLIRAISYLRNLGVTWMDIQMMTPHMERYGAKLISRDKFMKMLRDSL